MEIIVEISEDDYNRIIDKSYRSNNPDYSAAEYAIANGTVLPNNHGRLIDEKELVKYIIHDNCDDGCGYIDERDLIDIPTVFWQITKVR